MNPEEAAAMQNILASIARLEAERTRLGSELMRMKAAPGSISWTQFDALFEEHKRARQQLSAAKWLWANVVIWTPAGRVKWNL